MTVRLVVSVHKSQLPSWLSTTLRPFHLTINDREAAVVTEPDTVVVVDLPAGPYELRATELIKPRPRWLGWLPRGDQTLSTGHYTVTFGELESDCALRCQFYYEDDSGSYEFDLDSNPLEVESVVPLAFSDLPPTQDG